MSAPLVNNVSLAGNGTSAAINTTGASLIFVQITVTGSGSAPTFSDSASNTWSTIAANTQGTIKTYVFYLVNPTISTTHTFTVSGSTNTAMCVAAFSGLNISDTTPAASSTNGGSSVTTMSSNGGSSSQTSQLTISYLGATSTGTVSTSASFVVTNTVASSGSNQGASLSYFQSGDGSYAATVSTTWTIGATAASATVGGYTFYTNPNVVSVQTGNWGTASTWGAVDNLASGSGTTGAAELDSEAGTTVVTTSTTYSATWTNDGSTIAGIAVKLNAVSGSPTGTFTVSLVDNSGPTIEASVVVNVADLPASPGKTWCYFKFGSSFTMLSGHTYKIGCISSSSNQVTLYTNGTASNWSRKLVTTTTQAPTVNNNIVISKAYTGAGTSTAVTVTYDVTATTVWGCVPVNTQGVVVGGAGTLTLQGSASTAYKFSWTGMFLIAGGGTVNFGSSGSNLPSTSSLAMLMSCQANLDTNIKVDAGGTLNIYGASKTPWTQLTANASAAATSITVAAATGWKDADVLAFSPTDTSSAHYETKSIASSGVSGLTITLASGLTNAHTGQGLPTNLQGYVGNLTRNITIAGTSVTLRGAGILVPAAGGTMTLEYVQIDGATLGAAQSSTQSALSLSPTTNSVYMTGCTHNPSSSTQNQQYFCNISGSTVNNVTVDNFVMFQLIDNGIYVSSNSSAGSLSLNITNNLVINGSSQDNGVSINIGCTGAVVTGNVVAVNGGSATTSGISFYNIDGTSFNMMTATNFQNNTGLYCTGAGIEIGGSVNFGTFGNGFGGAISIQNCQAYRNAAGGILFQGPFRSISIANCDLMGNGNSTSFGGITFSSSTSGPTACVNAVITGTTFSSDTSFNQANGLSFTNANNYAGLQQIRMYNCTMGVATGIRSGHGTSDFEVLFPQQTVVQVWANKCNFASSTLQTNFQSSFQQIIGDHIDNTSSFIRSQDDGQTPGNHKTTVPQGVIKIDTTLYNTASPSQRLTPNTATYKLRSGPQQCSVSSGVNRTVAVYIRRSATGSGDAASYNGNQPRLIVRRNDAVGITADTVLATGSAAIGNWEQISGTVTSPSEDGAIEVYVDCDGTAGWVNCDDYSIS